MRSKPRCRLQLLGQEEVTHLRAVQNYPHDVWYFAYGSNLEVEQKENRTGSIREARRCRLPGYRLAFNKRGKTGQNLANIVPNEAKEVWGAAYRCRPEALVQMDNFEGVGVGHYNKVVVEVLTDSGDRLQAVTYIAGSSYICPEGHPSREYVDKIINGAKHHHLPAAYIEEIERLSGLR